MPVATDRGHDPVGRSMSSDPIFPFLPPWRKTLPWAGHDQPLSVVIQQLGRCDDSVCMIGHPSADDAPTGYLTMKRVMQLLTSGVSTHTMLGSLAIPSVLTSTQDHFLAEAEARFSTHDDSHVVVMDAQRQTYLLDPKTLQTYQTSIVPLTPFGDTSREPRPDVFRSLLDSLPDQVWLKDVQGRYLSCNRQFEHIAGCSEQELIGKNDYDLFPREDADYFRHNDALTVQKDAARKNEEILRHADGSYEGHYEVIKTPMKDEAQNLIGILGIARDISNRRFVEKELQAERDLFTDGPVAVLVWRPEEGWRVSYASANIGTVFGFGPDEMMAGDFRYSDCVHPEDAERVGEEVSRFFEEGRTSWEQRYRIVRKDGSVAWLYDYTVAEWNDKGKVEVLRGYVLDETNRVESEARLRLSATVFDNAHEGIMVTDAAQRILDVNPTFTEITGYSRDDVLGERPSILKSERQSDDFYSAMWRVLDTQGYWRGELFNRRKNGTLFTALTTISAIHDTQGVLTHYVSVFSDITQMKTHQERLEMLAHYDSLTRLPNRVLLADRMEQMLTSAQDMQGYIAVCYIDLDGFKQINDQYGHDVGDQLLVEVAQRLQSSLRGHDTVARLGGDEFVLLLSELESVHTCELTAERVLSLITRPIHVEGLELQVSASMGITLYPDDGSDADLLLRHADQAMYQAKMTGRNRYQLYDLDHDQRAVYRREAIADIRRALHQEEFVLYFQPQVDLIQQKVQGFEMLIRWQHPQKGLLVPAHFLPLINGHPVEIELDHWVLQQAFARLQDWQQQGYALRLSVNLSGATLLADDFMPRLRSYIHAYPRMSPGLLEIEVLETSALEDITHAGEIFEACQDLGFRIALDDFGTGYSSLTYFRRLPAETLKIDQSFIFDMLSDKEDLAIVESVIGLAQAFNRQLVAEGVESAEHGQLLVQMGCTVVQGYGIARPMPVEQALDWADSWRPSPEWVMETGYHSPEQRALLLASREHQYWLDELLLRLNGTPPENASRPDDYHSCRFGRWYYGLGGVQLGHRAEFREIEPVHKQLHQWADHLVRGLDHLNEGERLRGRQQLIELSHSLQQQIQNLQRILVAEKGVKPIPVTH